MDSYLKENFGDVKAKNSSKRALQTRRKACWLMKNRKRRFRFTANLSKRSEADAIRRTFKEVHEDSPVHPLNKEESSDGDDHEEVHKNSPVRPLNKKDSSDGDDEKEVHKNSPVRPLIEEDSSDGDDEKVNRKNDVGNSSRRRITSWEKCKLLGSGSFGIVYEGITDDGFFFAIKEVYLLDPGSQDEKSLLQLQQEISILSQLDHENIVRYLGSDKDDNKLCIFLELMTKGSLATLYHKHELRDSQVSEYTRQILNGLKYLHDRKVVHRDIKCANILVDASGLVKLADFGLAKATEMNAAKTWAGSYFWMAPEVVNPKLISSRPKRSYGLEVDIWSLGCTVLEMLTRQHPYPKLEIQQPLFKIGSGKRPPVPRSLSSDAQDFILKCLTINPKDRPSATKLLHHPFVRKPPTTCAFASSLFNDNSHNALPDSFPNGVQEEIDPSASNLQGWHPVSPWGSFKRKITSWKKCQELGYRRVRGLIEYIYEVNTDDGSFFTVSQHVLFYPPNHNQRLLEIEQAISLLSQFEHENIVQYFGRDKDDKNLYIFLEPMTKGSLATFYARNNLRDSQVSAYTRKILNGLRYLHEQKVIHRNIRCANILVDASGSVKLAEFGLAPDIYVTDFKGSVFWMAPEVVNLKFRSYGLEADIWSLGCTVLEMLTCQPPYSSLEAMQALFRIGRGEPPPVPDSISRDARDLILKCLQVNPNNRPSAAQLLDHPFVRKPPTPT